MSSRAVNDSCVLCCHKSKEWAIGVCNHVVCLICSARMRILCEQKECPVCRLPLEQIVVVSTIKSFQDLSFSKWLCRIHLGMYFESRRLMDKFYAITDNSCNLCPDFVHARSFRKLREHVRTTHNRFFCEICVEGLKLFPTEFKTYTRQELATHWRQGDKDDTSHKGHPLCLFCSERYLDNDTLHSHLRKNHFWCHFCEAEGRQDYYVNCFALRKHFKEEHYLCEEGNCRNEVLTSAFNNEIDLKAHKASVHGKGMTKAEAKQARALPVEFTYTDHHSDCVVKRRGQSHGRGPSSGNPGPSDSRGSRPSKTREREDREVVAATIESMTSSSERPTPGPSSSPVSSRKKTSAAQGQSSGDGGCEPPPPVPPPGFERKCDITRTSQVVSNGIGTLSQVQELKESEAEGKLNDSWPVLGAAVSSGGNSQTRNTLTSSPPPPPPPGLWGSPKKEGGEGKEGYSKKAASKKPIEQPIKNSSKQNLSMEAVLQKPTAEESVANKPGPSRTSNVNISGSRIFEDIRRALGYDKDKFKEFQSLSGWYRSGGLSVQQYNSQCEELFGEQWIVIGPQLAKVMPPGETRDKLIGHFSTLPSVSKTTGSKQKTKKNKSKKDVNVTSNAWVTVGEDSRKPHPGGRGQVAFSEDEYPSLSTAAKLPPQPKVPLTTPWNHQVHT